MFKNLIVYRGMFIDKSDFEKQFMDDSAGKKKWITQKGFQCTSMDKDVAISYAC